jgi:hypothetical protein
VLSPVAAALNGGDGRYVGKNPVQVFATGLPLHWEFLRLRTGFELPSSCPVLPCYAPNRKRNFRIGRDLHWEFLRLRTGFELPSSWFNLPCYGVNLNRNILDFMRWPQIDLGAQDLNGFQRPKFRKSSWK